MTNNYATATHLAPTDSNILIVGLVRNGEKWIYQSLETLEKSFSSFSKIQWLIVESDSDDGTVMLLDDLAKQENNFRYIAAGLLRNIFPQRTARIAYCRNIYINELLKNPIYSTVEYVVIADLDGVNSSLSESAIESCWLRDDWDVCTANQNKAYYDIWALRHPFWCPNDCWEQFSFLNKYINPDYSLISAVISKMIEIPKNSEWIEVDSAFGGLGIYRREAISDEVYIGLNNLGAEVCEHVSFHKELRAKGKKIFINPALINGELNEHSVKYEEIFRAMKII